VSTPSPPAAKLSKAAHLGHRHGKAAVYRQIGDSGSNAALEFYRYLPCGGAEITGLFEMPRPPGGRTPEEPTAPCPADHPQAIGEVSS
jgi:hypothetical protein